MNRILLSLFLAIIIFSSCRRAHERIDTDIHQRWEFVEIEGPDGQQIRSVAPGDYMDVRRDNTFHYLLEVEKIEESGRWEREGDIITYYYERNDTMRTYNIEELTDTTLIFEENGVRYRFRR